MTEASSEGDTSYPGSGQDPQAGHQHIEHDSTGPSQPGPNTVGTSPHPDAILPPPMSAHEPGDRTADLVVAWSSSIRRVSPANRAWLTNSRPVTMHTSTAMIAVHNEFTRDRIETKMRSELEELLSDHFRRPIHLAITIDPDIELALGAPDSSPQEAEEELPPAEFVPKVNPGDPDALPYRAQSADERLAGEANGLMRLNPKYTFDTFVTGPSNQFPAAACRAVAENPGKAYNPLFIYGQPGLGKTHLLHAIGHYARELKPEIRVRYVSSEEMTNEFINAIQGGPLALDQFKRNYRNLDLLIVDDIQFLQGKESTQEEFFHTFNALYQANHQIVLSSDRPPSQLTTLEDRLRTRFEGGLTTDVKTPDLETRMAILAKKSLLNGAAVPRDVLEFIASRNESSIRELEGALTRVVAYCSMTGEPVTIAAAEVVVKDILPQDVKITPEMVIEVIADHFTVSIDQLTGPSKVRKIVTARQFGMFLTREYCEMSTTKIGEVYGGRDHTTVMHAEKKMRTAIQENTAIFEQFQELTQKIKSRARQR